MSGAYELIFLSLSLNFNNAKKHLAEKASKALYGVFRKIHCSKLSDFGVWGDKCHEIEDFFPEKHHKVSLRLALSNAFKRY